MAKLNTSWNLESFLDSLIIELDKAQDTLSVKAVNRPLTYTVRDVAFELQIFPEYDGSTVRFTTAKPGEAGASRISIQLGSITDRQARDTTKKPVSGDDVSVDLIEDIDEETKTELRKIGVTSGQDLERLQARNIDLTKVSKQKVDYQKLANLINRSRRKQQTPPQVSRVSVASSNAGPVLAVEGENLVLSSAYANYPRAFLDDQPLSVVTASNKELQLAVDEGMLKKESSQLTVALDPYAVFRIEIKSQKV